MPAITHRTTSDWADSIWNRWIPPSSLMTVVSLAPGCTVVAPPLLHMVATMERVDVLTGVEVVTRVEEVDIPDVFEYTGRVVVKAALSVWDRGVKENDGDGVAL